MRDTKVDVAKKQQDRKYSAADKKTATARIWQERFGDTQQWMEMVHSRIYNDRNCLTIEDEGQIVSQLLLRDIEYQHLGQPMPATYIYGAATRRDSQRKGYMTELMIKALSESRERGATVAFLKPAQRWLYDFYGRFGFAGTVYIDEQRYTSAHHFATADEQMTVETTVYDVAELTEAYKRLASLRPSSSLHNQTDFMTILIDNSIDDGVKAVVRNRLTSEICAIAFAVTDSDNNIVVRDLAATDELSAEVALGSIMEQLPGRSMVVDCPTCYRQAKYEIRGMARIVNVERFLELSATVNPKLKMTIRVTDRLMPENNGIFKIEAGKVEEMHEERRDEKTHLDLDVEIDVLTSIFFSSPKIGEIFNLPTARPFISLMLD